ncbi:hypothetical protein GTA09_21650 [Rhodococcus hoagii]|nr:hypothetical protein [Prescottella equi]
MADNHFAAQLDKVVRDSEHYPVYGDPDSFFAQTYATSGLRTLLTKTFGRVSGAKGVAGENGVLRPTTSFGGGKTPRIDCGLSRGQGTRPANLAEFVDPAILPDGPVQIAALVGDALDPVCRCRDRRHRTYTLWGEMAAQIGSPHFRRWRPATSNAPLPAPRRSRRVRGAATVVIIDEIAKYIRQVTRPQR